MTKASDAARWRRTGQLLDEGEDAGQAQPRGRPPQDHGPDVRSGRQPDHGDRQDQGDGDEAQGPGAARRSSPAWRIAPTSRRSSSAASFAAAELFDQAGQTEEAIKLLANIVLPDQPKPRAAPSRRAAAPRGPTPQPPPMGRGGMMGGQAGGMGGMRGQMGPMRGPGPRAMRERMEKMRKERMEQMDGKAPWASTTNGRPAGRDRERMEQMGQGTYGADGARQGHQGEHRERGEGPPAGGEGGALLRSASAPTERRRSRVAGPRRSPACPRSPKGRKAWSSS